MAEMKQQHEMLANKLEAQVAAANATAAAAQQAASIAQDLLQKKNEPQTPHGSANSPNLYERIRQEQSQQQQAADDRSPMDVITDLDKAIDSINSKHLTSD